jgi:hypothetical protein
VGEGEVDADADVRERREAGAELRKPTGEGGMAENAVGETPEEERHGPRMRARQKGPHLRIEAGRILQRDKEAGSSGPRRTAYAIHKEEK